MVEQVCGLLLYSFRVTGEGLDDQLDRFFSNLLGDLIRSVGKQL